MNKLLRVSLCHCIEASFCSATQLCEINDSWSFSIHQTVLKKTSFLFFAIFGISGNIDCKGILSDWVLQIIMKTFSTSMKIFERSCAFGLLWVHVDGHLNFFGRPFLVSTFALLLVAFHQHQ